MATPTIPALPDSDMAQTILYLRPQGAAIRVLDLPNNASHVRKVAPALEPVNIPLGEIPHHRDTVSHDHGRTSRESTPGLYLVSPRVLRLGFDSIELPYRQEFTFGSGDISDVEIPYISKRTTRNPLQAYFQVHYNFNSGALLITALDEIKVGAAVLNRRTSLLLMVGSNIRCGGEFEFIVEFPDISDCAIEHEQNYQEYAAKLGFPEAQYLRTPQSEYAPIGAEHRSVAVLGKGGFGEVHKALHTKTGQFSAIKILNGDGQDEVKEVNIMSKLSHDNIIKYERAFQLPTGQICIVMELAVNDLSTQLKARQNGKGKSYLTRSCIQSIAHQALSGLVYLHGEGYMHRDLKPQNILVTKWDPQTDTPTIKLGDFGLVGINPEGKSLCGTEGYMAPEIAKAWELQKQVSRGNTATPVGQPLMYTNAIDIWGLGKILKDLVRDVPATQRLLGGTIIPAKKDPAIHLINRMMQDDPNLRPTAAACLQDPWMATINESESLTASKRGGPSSPGPSSPTSSSRQPLRKVIRIASNHSVATEDVSASFLDEPRVNQQAAVGDLDQFSMPADMLTDEAINDKTPNVTHPSVTSTGSNASQREEASQGLTYPSGLDDDMVSISF